MCAGRKAIKGSVKYNNLSDGDLLTYIKRFKMCIFFHSPMTICILMNSTQKYTHRTFITVLVMAKNEKHPKSSLMMDPGVSNLRDYLCAYCLLMHETVIMDTAIALSLSVLHGPGIVLLYINLEYNLYLKFTTTLRGSFYFRFT